MIIQLLLAVTTLVADLSQEQKIGQLNQINARSEAHEQLLRQMATGKIGSVMNIAGAFTDTMQQVSLEQTGIPMLFARDVIHGYHTIFPIPLGQACSWDVDLVTRAAQMAAREAKEDGIRWFFSPMIDVVRDPRWGRVAESFGEDTYFTSVMGSAVVRGYQSLGVAACAKHFAGYGAAEGGRDYNTTWIPEVQLRETYLPPFKAAVDAGCMSIMCSFNEINGVPSSANKHLLTDILRDEWLFDGVLDSDWGSIEQLIAHGIAKDKKQAAVLAMQAGVDMDMMGYVYKNHLVDLVKEGTVQPSEIDTAVQRLLRLKEKLNLWVDPYIHKEECVGFYQSDALELSAQMASASAVLLKNDSILPLHKDKKYLITGPLANSDGDQVGCWTPDYEPGHCVTPLMALQQRVKTIYSPGCSYSRENDSKKIKEAIAAAKKADIILFFAGEEQLLSGEAQSLADLNLRGGQRELLRGLAATGKPVVMIIMAGRPLTIEDDLPYASAVIYAYHGGTMAGEGLARVMMGETVPSGKLTMSIPRHVGQIPMYYNHTNTGRPAKQDPDINSIPVGAKAHPVGAVSFYLDYGTKPLFPFGYGLSYTTFEYSNVTLNNSVMHIHDSIKATCTITNKGAYDAYEVAQLYIRDEVGERTRPLRELKSFQKIWIPAGQSRTIEFTLTSHDLSYWHENMSAHTFSFTPDPGAFKLWIAPNSVDGEAIEFEYK